MPRHYGIDDDDLQSGRRRGLQGLESRDAAVDGNDQAGAFLLQAPQGGPIGAVSLDQAVGNVDPQVTPGSRRKALQEGGGSGPVDVIIAKDRNDLARRDRLGETLCRLIHIAQAGRVGHHALQSGIEEILYLVGIHTACRQHPAENLRRAEALSQGQAKPAVG